ncbi:Ribosome-releasing factor 2, mitochondrial [Coemansia spiralis]|uniref:Elongation factor 2 n=1 Tax=Coemansia spiralis TaxID=417178 RepID=A0A9W8G4R4_9FUNG|nr:Ribosome-releasing factor 2, mitochondrial [Coemansia spiralis]
MLLRLALPRVLGAAKRPSTLRQTRPLATRVPPDAVRNLGIIAHIEAGKTTTTERMLHYAGLTRSIGDVDDGDTVMDYLPMERERGITIQSAATTFGWRSHQLHLIDTPGHIDFTVEVERALRVLDGAVVILDAVAGVQAQTLKVWRQAEKNALPRVVFVNKMDREGADWRACVDELSRLTTPLVLMLPGPSLEQWYDVVTMELIVFDPQDKTGATLRRSKVEPPTAELSEARVQLVEALAALDAQIVDVFLSAGDHLKVPAGELRAAIRRATLTARACPVLLGAAFRNIGVQPLLDAVVDYLPAPGVPPAPLDPRKLVAFAFKVTVDPQRGPMVFVRVYAGTLDARMALVNQRTQLRERATKLLQMYGDAVEEIAQIAQGHIGVIVGLKATRTGDTLCEPKVKAQLHGIDVPPPVFVCAVEADAPQDERPLAQALSSLVLEDPSIVVEHNEETGQMLLRGMGELHLEVVQDRLRRMKVNASFGKVRVAYREMAGRKASVSHTYAREIAGRMHKAAMAITVEPAQDNTVEVELGDAFEGAEQPSEVHRAIVEGIEGAMSRGTLLGFPVARTRVTVTNVEHFNELSTLPAFRACAAQTLHHTLASADSVLLEPLALTTVECPGACVGPVLGDLSMRRARIVSIDHGEEAHVVAEVPLGSMLGYSSELRSLTAGAATFSMEVVGFGPVPALQQKRIIQESRGY